MNETSPSEAPFDQIVVPGHGLLDLDSFLKIPLMERVSLILARDLEFRRGQDRVDRTESLRWLRNNHRYTSNSRKTPG